jgi:hypothetical protein
MKPALLLLCYAALALPQAQAPPAAHFPCPEKLTYQVDWRLINAGTATWQLSRDNSSTAWNFHLNIVSAGLVSRLYRVLDTYRVSTSDHFCLANASLDAQEGKKHTFLKINVDRTHNRLSFEQRDLLRNRIEQKNLDIAPCTYDIAGALANIRSMNLEPGHSVTVPVTDGKKFVNAKLTAQAREEITVAGKHYQTTRYEAFVFDNVLYRRRGRLLLWISNDADRVPVQFRMLLGFPIGTVTISLQKQEH